MRYEFERPSKALIALFAQFAVYRKFEHQLRQNGHI